MFLEIVRSEGLSHLSYVVGDGNQAAIIDPRRDCDIYMDIAYRNKAQITHIFETHKNEDYVIGSKELAERTGAEIYHGHAFPFEYGKSVRENDTFDLGDIRLRILETPGHTDESISIILVDRSFGEDAIAAFTGDALFIGEVGRTDFFPDRAEEVAGLLYDSIFNKLLPLGDQVILYPAHGAGSVCGAGMASREFSTLGYERKYNPRLQMDRDTFIRFKVGEHHYQPPYFRKIEELNRKGSEGLVALPKPRPLTAEQFAQQMDSGMVVLDVRSPEAVAGALVPGSIAIPLEMIPSFGGWFLPYDKPIGLVIHADDEVEKAVRFLVRMGYDHVIGYLDEGLHAWETSGRLYHTIPAVHASEVKERIDNGTDYTLLDVRKIDEYKAGYLPNAKHIYVGEIEQRLAEVPASRPITTFCGTGQRSIIASSILMKHGIEEVEVCLGSMAACTRVGCPVINDQAT
jgi:hydroxyacylglutathione hydrolase